MHGVAFCSGIFIFRKGKECNSHAGVVTIIWLQSALAHCEEKLKHFQPKHDGGDPKRSTDMVDNLLKASTRCNV